MNRKSDTQTPRIYLVIGQVAPLFAIFFIGSVATAMNLSPEAALLPPFWWIFGLPYVTVPAIVLGVLGIVKRRVWMVMTSTSVLSILLLAAYWIANGLRNNFY